MKPCRECRREISEQAFACPQCGAPYPARDSWNGWGGRLGGPPGRADKQGRSPRHGGAGSLRVDKNSGIVAVRSMSR
jgi:hypothetical protein